MSRMRVVRVGLVLLAMALPIASAGGGDAGVDPEALFNQGLSHLREGRADLAVDAFRKAVKADPKNSYAYKGLGLAYARQGKFKDAIEALRKALELNPYYVDVRNDLGSALILSGKREDGKKEFLAAFNDPTNPTPEVSCRNLGQAYLEEKNYPEAFNWFQSSLQRNKSYPDAYLGLADTLLAQGKADEALAFLESAARTLPDEPSMMLALGQGYYRAGRFTEARARLQQAYQKDPGGTWGQQAAELLRSLPK